jgi:hypothetical protein
MVILLSIKGAHVAPSTSKAGWSHPLSLKNELLGTYRSFHSSLLNKNINYDIATI